MKKLVKAKDFQRSGEAEDSFANEIGLMEADEIAIKVDFNPLLYALFLTISSVLRTEMSTPTASRISGHVIDDYS